MRLWRSECRCERVALEDRVLGYLLWKGRGNEGELVKEI